jgi:hypothetical protein
MIGFWGCKEAVDFYIGIPLQPKFEEDSFIPGLNIFGIIRLDSTSSINNSFVDIQKAVPAVGSEDSIYTDTTLVYIEQINSSIEDSTCEFKLGNYNNTFKQDYYRPTCNFKPKSGDIYRIECTHTGLPVLTAHTIVPEKPVLIKESVYLNQKLLFFELLYDSTIFMYDIYIFSNGYISGSKRIPASTEGNTEVEVNLISDFVDSIETFSYDFNLANYYLTSNVSLNFNKYRESFSEVENGYGVFGSLNRDLFYINKEE